MKVVLIGSNGFVGSAIANSLKKKEIATLLVNRNNYHKKNKKKVYDFLINSAIPSKRYAAKLNPNYDFKESFIKTKKILEEWKFKKYIHISSISARCEKNTPYGINRLKSENLSKKINNHLIVRLGPMFGCKLNKGVIIDLINNNTVFLNKESKYSFTNVNWVGEWIVNNLLMKGLIEIGAKDFIVLKDLAQLIKSSSNFRGRLDDQIIKNSLKYSLSSNEVIKFINKMKKNENN